jgi:hypothetical protein
MPRITKKIIIVSVSSTALGRQFPFHPRLWVLYLNPTLSVTARVFLAYPEDLTIQRTTLWLYLQPYIRQRVIMLAPPTAHSHAYQCRDL